MILKNLYIKDFLGIALFNAVIDKPVCLVAGPNASGKSSIQNAVRMIVTGEPSRVTLKGKYGELVQSGAPCSTIALENEKAETLLIKKSGETTGAVTPGNVDDEVHACLDPGFFTRLSEAERKSFLLKMFKVGVSFDEIKDTLLEQGIQEEYIDELQGPLRLGFREAAKEAKARMSVSRIEWKKITNETHGVIKAEGWRMALPAIDKKERLYAAQRQIEIANRIVRDKRTQIEAKKYFDSTLEKNKRILEGLRREYEMPVLSEAKINKMQKGVSHLRHLVSGLEKSISDTKKAAPGDKPKPVHFLLCPECSTKLVMNGPSLALYTPPKPVDRKTQVEANKEALSGWQADLNSKRLELGELSETYEQAVRDVRNVEEARIKIEAIESSTKVPEEVEGSVEELEDSLEHVLAELALLLEYEEVQNSAALEYERTERINTESARVHREFTAWSLLFDQMSPSGIPSSILKPCVNYINESLRQYSEQTEWWPVRLTEDCGITFNGRNYYLLSESEQWRCDVMIAAAIAEGSGYKFVMVDRLDVLSPANRPVFLNWCRVLAEESDFQFLLFATLKNPPSINSDWLQPIWIEDGVINQ